MERISKYSLVCVGLGLLSLFLISKYQEPEVVEISKIDKNYLNQIIQTSGWVKSSYLSNSSTLFLILENNGSKIKVVKFDVEDLSFSKGDWIKVKGEVSLYKNELEIVAREIEKME